MNYVKEYYDRIAGGDIITSKRVKTVYARLVAEMDAAGDDFPYYFDEETGERPILFIETFCKHLLHYKNEAKHRKSQKNDAAAANFV